MSLEKTALRTSAAFFPGNSELQCESDFKECRMRIQPLADELQLRQHSSAGFLITWLCLSPSFPEHKVSALVWQSSVCFPFEGFPAMRRDPGLPPA